MRVRHRGFSSATNDSVGFSFTVDMCVAPWTSYLYMLTCGVYVRMLVCVHDSVGFAFTVCMCLASRPSCTYVMACGVCVMSKASGILVRVTLRTIMYTCAYDIAYSRFATNDSVGFCHRRYVCGVVDVMYISVGVW